jgi:hypothetical protein
MFYSSYKLLLTTQSLKNVSFTEDFKSDMQGGGLTLQYSLVICVEAGKVLNKQGVRQRLIFLSTKLSNFLKGTVKHNAVDGLVC